MTKQKRLTDIEKLARTASEECRWLFDTLQAGNMDQSEIHPEFNRRVEARGERPVSYSALNRYALKVRSGDVHRPGGSIAANVDPVHIIAAPIKEAIAAKHGIAAVAMIETALIAIALR